MASRKYRSPACLAAEADAEMARAAAAQVSVKRIYEPALPSDGFRLLVDRLWPRGISKARAQLDAWSKDLAPSTKLRVWFNHEPGRWREFRRRYRAELKDREADLEGLRDRARRRPLTLLYAARDPAHNQASVLRGVLQSVPRSKPRKSARSAVLVGND